jgi:GNAT superfamily N-acetyltransferase
MRARLVMPADLPAFRALVQEGAAATEPELGFDEDAFLEAFHTGLMGRDLTIFAAETPGGRLAGFLVCRVDGFLFAAGLSARLMAVYVAREYRGSRAAAVLLGTFLEWSKRVNARKLVASIDNNPNPRAAARLFARYGFRPVGVAVAA